MSNKMTIKDKFNTYLKHPGSFVVYLLVMLAAVITFAVLIFLIVYILVNGLPHITPSCPTSAPFCPTSPPFCPISGRNSVATSQHFIH